MEEMKEKGRLDVMMKKVREVKDELKGVSEVEVVEG